MPGIERNEPCPCGSGKKFKKCCGSRPHNEIKPEASTKKRQIDEILKYLSRYQPEAVEIAYDIFWDEFDPHEHLDSGLLGMGLTNFWDWAVCDALVDYDDPDNKVMLLDRYIEDNRKNLTEDDLHVLAKLKNSFISLYEVTEVYPDEGLLLTDLLLGDAYEVRERTATRYLNTWDIIAVRLLEIDGNWSMAGGVYSYHRHRKDTLLNEVQTDFEFTKEEEPGITMREYLKENGDFFNYYWYEPLLYPEMPTIATSSGEALIISKAHFEVSDKGALIDALSAIEGFERDEEHFIWVGETGKMSGNVVLGQITFEGERLILETSSKERLEMGKELILKNAMGLVKHKADEFQDILQALEQRKVEPEDKADDIPPEMCQQIYEQFMRDYYENWLNEPSPALGNKNPLQAVKTKAGKTRLTEILKSIENAELRNKKQGQPHMDITWLWERLGIGRAKGR